MSQKYELIIAALQQRIGEIVSTYETQVAVLRAEMTEMVNRQQEKEKELDNYNEDIIEKMENA